MDRSLPQQPPGKVASRYGVRSEAVARLVTATPTAPDAPKRVKGMVLRPDEPLGVGLQRLALEQLEIAHDYLAVPTTDETWDRGVHKARKAMKRTRALLRMVRDDLGYETYRNENVVLRDQARRFSGVRSALVVAQTLDRMVADDPDVLPVDVVDELYAGLVDRHAAQSSGIRNDKDGLAAAKLAIGLARQRVAAWPQFDIQREGEFLHLRRRVGESFGEIEPGIRRVYRRGRRALSAAREERTALAFHEWRKRVKYLRYQVETLRGSWPDVMGGLTSSLRDLAEMLGQDNDLADLARAVHEDTSLVPSPLYRTQLLAAADRRRRTLQDRILPVGDRIYHERPREFTGRLEAYWIAWRSG